MWYKRFKNLLDRYKAYDTFEVIDLDTLDNNVYGDVMKELDEGSNFKLMIAHIIGIDSAGHTKGLAHKEFERKIQDAYKFISGIIDKMDQDTTLIVFGDHGMTDSGDHGGGAELELRTILFAHQKTPFPMYEQHNKMEEAFFNMDRTIKIGDLAAIVS